MKRNVQKIEIKKYLLAIKFCFWPNWCSTIISLLSSVYKSVNTGIQYKRYANKYFLKINIKIISFIPTFNILLEFSGTFKKNNRVLLNKILFSQPKINFYYIDKKYIRFQFWVVYHSCPPWNLQLLSLLGGLTDP